VGHCVRVSATAIMRAKKSCIVMASPLSHENRPVHIFGGCSSMPVSIPNWRDRTPWIVRALHECFFIKANSSGFSALLGVLARFIDANFTDVMEPPPLPILSRSSAGNQ